MDPHRICPPWDEALKVEILHQVDDRCFLALSWRDTNLISSPSLVVSVEVPSQDEFNRLRAVFPAHFLDGTSDDGNPIIQLSHMVQYIVRDFNGHDKQE